MSSIDIPSRPAPSETRYTTEALEQRLGQLIRHYLETRSPAIANSVVRHIELLCSHPGFEGGSGVLCSYLRLKAHWRWLAGPTGTAGGADV
ncbi:MAG: ATP dependent RNA helicase [Chromatiaceae bacterium]|nr:ATP dependent RNA helicase [Gammaproteobacteria bacterium]MCP5304172.1 ATP dependent RNA helicase [Chromatiaceae bacterium]MCP5313897.1 ATP dependent RNA helicase [Chromatiaceae bacterium]